MRLARACHGVSGARLDNSQPISALAAPTGNRRANLVHHLAFADHHPYSEADLVKLQEDAVRHGAALITTQKDWVRLPAEWRERVGFLPVKLELEDSAPLLAALAINITTIRHLTTLQ